MKYGISMKRNFSPIFMISIFLCFVYAAPSLSATITWTGGASGYWKDQANWNSSVVPNDWGDHVVIDGNAAQNTEVKIEGRYDYGVSRLEIQADDKLTISGGGSFTALNEITGGGTITTLDTSMVYSNSLLAGITYNGTGTGALINFKGTVEDIKNQSGTLVLKNSTIKGAIVNNGTLEFQKGLNDDINGFFGTTEIGGTGKLSGIGWYTALDSGDVLTISGQQTLTNGSSVSFEAGTLNITGFLGTEDGDSAHTFNSNITGTGKIDTQGTSVIQTGAVLSGITHTGSDTAYLSNKKGTVEGIINQSGNLRLINSTIKGAILNNGTMDFQGEDSDINGFFGTGKIDGTGKLSGIGRYSALTSSDVLTISGNQTLTDDSSVSFEGGTLNITGFLGTGNGYSAHTVNSGITGTGKIDTQGTSVIQTGAVLSGITHTGSDTAYLSNKKGTVEGIINASGNLRLINSTIKGAIINNGTMDFQGEDSDINGSFGTGKIDGTGRLSGIGWYSALTSSDVLTISGRQTLANGSSVSFEAGTLNITGVLGTEDGDSAHTFNSDITGTGTIDTQGISVIQTGAVLSGITHTGSDTAYLTNEQGTVKDVINQSGNLVLNQSQIEGRIENSGTILAVGGPAVFSNSNTGLVQKGGTIIGDVTIDDDGILTGYGNIYGDLVSTGLIQLILADHQINLGDFTTITPHYDFTSAPPGTGKAYLGGRMELSFSETGNYQDGSAFDILTANDIVLDAIVFDLIGLNDDWGLKSEIISAQDQKTLRITLVDADNGAGSVPEPATLMLFGIGLLSLAGVSRKK